MTSPTRGALCLSMLTAVLALLAACETTPSATTLAAPVPVETRSVPSGDTQAAATAGGVAAQSQVATVDLATGKSGAGKPVAPPQLRSGAAAAAPPERMVFFDFDSDLIKDDYKALLDGHAKALAASGGRRMTIEGHTDERGGREYNVALGQRRAEAVVKSLKLLGVSEQQLEAVSFGKERALQQGSDEAAWSRNRRAELKDR